MTVALPDGVQAAYERAEATGFLISSEPPVGNLLAVLAGAVPPGGKVLEIGAGVGVGLAWIEHALRGRDDVAVFSIEIDAERAALVEAVGWPETFSIVVGDGAELVERLVGEHGRFDLIFADCPGGKVRNLDATVEALTPGGLLLVDDMDLTRSTDPDEIEGIRTVAKGLHSHERLTCVDLPCGSGMILASATRAT
jgi:demethylmenaquinone methyltransferase/2-methoxy-6-polyprenyl-1,4-benzoquinol methylase